MICVGSYSLREHTHTVMSLSEEVTDSALLPVCLLFHNQEIVKRDQSVFEQIHKVYKIPIAILLGGGYCVST